MIQGTLLNACAGRTEQPVPSGFFGWVLSPVVLEQCDGVDNDCDGRIDDSTICSPCPFGMVLLTGIPTNPSGLCIDSYEASRPDATASDGGSSALLACDTDSTGSASAGYHGFRCCVPPIVEP